MKTSSAILIAILIFAMIALFMSVAAGGVGIVAAVVVAALLLSVLADDHDVATKEVDEDCTIGIDEEADENIAFAVMLTVMLVAGIVIPIIMIVGD